MYKLAKESFYEEQLLPYSGVGCGDKLAMLAKDGQTDYQIVISQTPSECEKYAANELSEYLNKATGAVFKVVTENEKTVLGDKRIAIGDTALFRTAKLNTANLNIDGFRIKTVGCTVFIKGERDRGTLYGVYDFLEKFACVRFLSSQFEYVPSLCELSIPEMDITEIPAFSQRGHFINAVSGDLRFAAKKRMTAPHNPCGKEAEKFGGAYLEDWTSDMHAFEILLPYEKYKDVHPEWFSCEHINPSQVQPVLSNGLNDDGTLNENMEESVLKEVIKNLKTLLFEKPQAIYVALGQNDNENFSTHPDCMRQYELFGGKSGQMIVFVNAVAREIKKWLKEEGIERELYFVTYSYQYTQNPPVKWLRNGDILPAHELVIPREDVYVMLALYEVSFNEPLYSKGLDDFNFYYYNQVRGWAAITKRFFIFDYGTNFAGMLAWYPNTDILAKNLAYFGEIGVRGVTTDSGLNDYRNLLHCYILSKLYWDTKTDVEKQISEFNRLFFGAEAGFMIDRLVRYIRNHFKAETEKEGYVKPAQIFARWLFSAETLGWNFVKECERLVDGAKWHLQTRTSYTEERKEAYLNNLTYLYVMLGYWKFRNYDKLFYETPEKKKAFLQEFYADLKKCDLDTKRCDLYLKETIGELIEKELSTLE